MKHLFFILLLATLSANAGELRSFTASDGRTLEARIVNYDADSGKVQIERADKKRITVSAEAFSAADQRYILKWAAATGFAAPSKLRIAVKREEVGTTEKKHEVDFSQENTGGRRGGGGVQTVAKDERTKYRYLLTLENKSGVPINNIVVEYRIYYNQQKPVVDEKANQYRPQDREVDIPDRYKAVDELKIKDGRDRLKPIAPKETRTFSTDAVTLLERKANRPYDDKINLKADLAGVWIRLTMKGPDGKEIVREIAAPASVTRKFPWDPPEEEAPAAQHEEKSK